MRNRIQELFRLTLDAGKHGMGMQQKLMLYWLSMLLAVFAVLLTVLSVAGVFSNSRKTLSQALTVRQSHTITALNEQTAALTAQGLAISHRTTDTLGKHFYGEQMSSLNDDARSLSLLEHELYDTLNTALRSAPCSGVYLILDATTNTAAAHAQHSRAGLYLRFANFNSKSAAEQDVVLYRGIPDVARANRHELHNRWKMEFDVSLIPAYQVQIGSEIDDLTGSCRWTLRTRLTDTWENVILLQVPILGSDGTVQGLCGVELGELYLHLSYPAQDSDFGSMVTLIAPMDGDTLLLDRGMSGGLDGTYLSSSDRLTVQPGKFFNTYHSSEGIYLGVHSRLDMQLEDGRSMYAVTLVPEECFRTVTRIERLLWFSGSALLLLVMVGVCILLSRRFVRPIARSLASIGSQDPADLTGIAEIDALVEMLRSREHNEQSLPSDIAELFDSFARRAGELTVTERAILRHYADGREVTEVAELSFISINTLRKHNANIYRKLEVGSRDELMLYLDLFRRIGRLSEILDPDVSGA